MLNDISKSIEILAPVSSSSYNSSKLVIASDKFSELLKHKKYLGDKYVKNNVFTERKETYESAKEKLKRLYKLADNSKSQNQRAQRPPSGRKLSSVSKKNSSIRESNGDYAELERINILNEEKIEQTEAELQQKDVVIQNLRKEIDNNKREIFRLNNLVIGIIKAVVLLDFRSQSTRPISCLQDLLTSRLQIRILLRINRK